MGEELNIQYIKGTDDKQDEFMDFINYVFHMNGKDNDFYRQLPKLYKKEYHPCEHNFMVLENNRIKAAVGAFPGEVSVCGSKLSYYGIGNVAVNPYARSKGYMRKLMNMAVEHAISEDVDFSLLAGRRQRYQYFSYETAGRNYQFHIDEDNIRHAFGKDRRERFRFIQVKEESKDVLKEIADLQEKQPVHYKRKFEKLYDILMSWKDVDVYGIFEDLKFSGYLLCYGKSKVKEIILVQQEDILEVIADFITTIAHGGVSVDLPEYQRYLIDALTGISESVTMGNRYNFSVFHFDKVIRAFLELKAQTDRIADGEVVILIHGKKREEKLLIAVKDGKVSVSPTERVAEYEYSHLEAMSVLFSNYSPLRNKLPMEVQTWLPLPITIYSADEV